MRAGPEIPHGGFPINLPLHIGGKPFSPTGCSSGCGRQVLLVPTQLMALTVGEEKEQQRPLKPCPKKCRPYSHFNGFPEIYGLETCQFDQKASPSQHIVPYIFFLEPFLTASRIRGSLLRCYSNKKLLHTKKSLSTLSASFLDTTSSFSLRCIPPSPP